MEVSMDPLSNLQLEVKQFISNARTNFKKSPKERITQAYVETRLDFLEDQWKSFSETHRTIITDIDIAEYKQSSYYKDAVYEATQELYFEYKTELKESLCTIFDKKSLVGNGSQCIQVSNQSNYNTAAPQVKLPKITIPMFSGKYTEWPTFKDLFVSLVHDNPNLGNVQKLHYLKAHLEGEAEQLLRHVPITDVNYTESWTLLTRRFSNKKYLSNCLLKRMINQSCITGESSKAIKDLLDTTSDCLNGLKNLDLNVDFWDVIIIFLISSKLDSESRKLWEAQTSSIDEYPTMQQFKDFLEHRFRSLEFLTPKLTRNMNTIRNNVNVHNATTVSCPFCAENHRLFSCNSFASENIDSRRNFAQTKGLCYNCLVPGHSVFACRQSSRCRICHKKHHSLLHFTTLKSADCNVENPTADESNLNEAIPSLSNDEVNNVTAFHLSTCKQVLLTTALVKVESRSGELLTLRSLLDQGSQASFITESAVQALGLHKVQNKTLISGVGDQDDKLISKSIVRFKLQSIHDKNFTILVKAHVLKKLTPVIPSMKVKTNLYPNLVRLKLADPNFHTPNKVDLLLGADVFSEILVDGVLKGSPNSPIAQNTKLGWVLSGPICSEFGDESKLCLNNTVISLHTCVEDDLLKRFWELETEPLIKFNSKPLTQEEQDCEDLYAKTTTRDEEGRYIVKLPFHSDEPQCKFGNLKSIAERRLQSLTKRLCKNTDLKVQYSKVMTEYLTLDHMEELPEGERHNPNAVYLPHHAVVRDDRTTSKVRIVFDASCPGTNGVSLNNDLMVGPSLQMDLRHIVMRWRRHPIVLIADIVKMYRQIKVATQDTDYQRILWSDGDDIKHYRMLRVTFGTASAPYLAVKTLHQLAHDEQNLFPTVFEIITKDFYMDDLMTGCQTLKEGRKIYEEMNNIMKKGCFELQKWASNCKELIEDSDESKSNLIQESVEVKAEKVENEIGKVLGLRWNKVKDEFVYTVQLPKLSETVTKRKVLSDIAKLFDPLGWIAPSIIQGKIFIQKLWIAGLDWDQELPKHLLQEWIAFREKLSLLTDFTIPRWMCTTQSDVNVELHGFCDASKVAYAAVVYIRVVDETGQVHVNLVTAKTKVSPIKVVSIPRLELCGATLLTKLLCEVAEVLEIQKKNIHAWTDSEIVLAWLSSHPNRWKTFVANRVSEILTLIDRNQWLHVSSKDNPADCASRGIQPSNPDEMQMWKKGPSWLSEKSLKYSPLCCNQDTDLEERVIKDVVCIVPNIEEVGLVNRFSSLQKLLRVISFCRRFINAVLAKVRNQPKEKYPDWLTTHEIHQTAVLFIKQNQEDFFKEELRCLSSNSPIKRKSSIRTLNPFVDKDGVLRVGGRLQRAPLSCDMKNPILIPYKSHLTDLIIKEAHQRTLHGGPQLMLNYLRSKYWIINAKRAVKAYVHGCVSCIRYSSQSSNQLMGQLPTARVTPNRPFQQSGVDYAGPISIRTSKGRGHRSTKGYICLFVCMSTRAIHLEAVSDLTSDSFLAAFKRFVARRGHCSDLWSDNGTNFVGASRELAALLSKEKRIVNKDIVDWLSTNGTQWHFIPPRAPNFGGLWEAGVKSTKHHLRRVIGTSTLTFEELTTVLSQIEACLNSRPISQVIDSADNTFPLTPGHFLVGSPLVLPPDLNYESSNVSSLRRWQYTQKMLQDFWRRWSREYLTQFFQRYKWCNQMPEPKIGDIVLVKEDDLPPARWLYGIVTDKHPGLDQITRVVSLRCKGSIIKRPVSKLCVLPVAN